jgi:hypothetical protein
MEGATMESNMSPGIAQQAAVADADPTNLLEQLAAKRKEISENKETFIPIPGYDREPPLLLARYRLLEGPELAGIGQKVSREIKARWDRQLFAAIDTFIAACIGIYVDKGDGKPEPLTVNGDPVLGFDESLAEALHYKSELSQPVRGRDVVLGLFGKNDVMITNHAMQLNRWFGDTTVDVSQEFLGNP